MKKIDWGFYGYVLVGVLIVACVIASMISYMSLNNWDIRCVLVDCKPITVRESEK